MSFHSAISQTLCFGQLLGLMPISGIKSNESQLKQNVMTVQFFHFLLVFIGVFLFVLAVLALIFHQQNHSLGATVILIVYLSNFLTLILFYQLGKKWKNLILTWLTTVKSLPQPEDTSYLRHQLNLRLFIVASSSLRKLSLKLLTFELIEKFSVEYTLQTLMTLFKAMQCEQTELARVFYMRTYPSIFYYLPYSPFIGFVAKVISYIVTLSWAYRDLFIMNIGFALKLQFSRLNEVILAHEKREMPVEFWSLQRLNYQKLSSLVNDVDESICKITFLSLTVNVFFICVHLFNGL
jgi:Trehalose receptor